MSAIAVCIAPHKRVGPAAGFGLDELRRALRPAAAWPVEQDAILTATANAPDGIQGVQVRYRVEDVWRELPIQGGGSAFYATVPASQLGGDSLAYELVAEGAKGQTVRLVLWMVSNVEPITT